MMRSGIPSAGVRQNTTGRQYADGRQFATGRQSAAGRQDTAVSMMRRGLLPFIP